MMGRFWCRRRDDTLSKHEKPVRTPLELRHVHRTDSRASSPRIDKCHRSTTHTTNEWLLSPQLGRRLGLSSPHFPRYVRRKRCECITVEFAKNEVSGHPCDDTQRAGSSPAPAHARFESNRRRPPHRRPSDGCLSYRTTGTARSSHRSPGLLMTTPGQYRSINSCPMRARRTRSRPSFTARSSRCPPDG